MFSGSDLVAFADDDPRRAISEAARLIEADTLEPIEAYRALGLAYRVTAEPDESRRWLERGIEEAGRRDEIAEQTELHVTYSATVAMLGDFEKALSILDDAERIADETGANHARVQRAGMLARRGHIAEALNIYETAESALRSREDRAWLARLFNNRGLLHLNTGYLAKAERDLREGLALCERLGSAMSSAELRHNLGVVLTQRGNLLEALEYYTEAATVFDALGIPNSDLALDRCDTLMYAGLAGDALSTAATAIEDLARRHMVEEMAEGLMTYARTAEAAGAPNAGVIADRARDALAALGNHALSDAAAIVALRVRSKEPADAGSLLAEVAKVADQLECRDRRLPAATARLLAGRIALDSGDVATAARHLSKAKARLDMTDEGSAAVPLSIAVEMALTGGLLAEARGDTAQASRMARRGLATVEDIASEIGFAGQQAYVRGCALDLIHLQVRLALRSKGNARLFRWVEAGRTRFDQPPRLRRPDDEAVAVQLEQLRWVHTERADDPDDAELAVDQAMAEKRLRGTVRRAAASAGRTAPVTTIGALRSGLESNTAFVSWFSPDASMWELTVTDRGSRRRNADSKSSIRALADQMFLAMGGLAIGRPNAAESTATAGLALQAALLPDVPAERLVLSPPPDLFSVPWSALPSLTDRAVTVTPSAATYLRPRGPHDAGAHALVVAGPALDRSSAEAALVAEHYLDAEYLSPSEATTQRVVEGLAKADVAHFACHAVFRPDNAAFSYLKLADGPLFLYDLERLRSGPRTVVLSACSAARSGSTGNQLHGFVTALLRAGVRTVIAPIAPVPDTDETLDLVDRFHGELQAGASPAVALSRAKSYDDPLSAYTSHAFQCFGWG